MGLGWWFRFTTNLKYTYVPGDALCYVLGSKIKYFRASGLMVRCGNIIKELHKMFQIVSF